MSLTVRGARQSVSGRNVAPKDAGFALTEALAALVVTAITAAALLAALRSAIDRTEEAAARTMALRQARHLLAEASVGNAAALSASGELPEARLAWTRVVTPLPSNPNVASVVVEVTWTIGRRTGTARLETYRFLPR